MSQSDLVVVRLFYSKQEAAEAVGVLRAHGIDCEMISPSEAGDAPFPSVTRPYRLRVPPGVTGRVDALLGDKVEEEAEPDFNVRSHPRDYPSVTPGEIARGLDAIHRRRRDWWLAMLLGIPTLVIGLQFGTGGLIVAGGLVLAVTGVLNWRLRTVICPRCKRRFHEVRFGFNFIAKECLHCHLPLREERGAV